RAENKGAGESKINVKYIMAHRFMNSSCNYGKTSYLFLPFYQITNQKVKLLYKFYVIVKSFLFRLP
ncbi:MAG: hypothetical protein COX19_15510, partial [Desulfobacterales bacterium CG23_combo_of_CG06-09_8_20_14_all_51_8]